MNRIFGDFVHINSAAPTKLDDIGLQHRYGLLMFTQKRLPKDLYTAGWGMNLYSLEDKSFSFLGNSLAIQDYFEVQVDYG